MWAAFWAKDLASYDKHLTRSTGKLPAVGLSNWQLRQCEGVKKTQQTWNTKYKVQSTVKPGACGCQLCHRVFILHSLIGIGNSSVFINSNSTVVLFFCQKCEVRKFHYISSFLVNLALLPPTSHFLLDFSYFFLWHYWNSLVRLAELLRNWLTVESVMRLTLIELTK